MNLEMLRRVSVVAVAGLVASALSAAAAAAVKFIEANWGLSPLTSLSEDNLPNPAPGVYIPKNSPAIGNLMTEFNFHSPHFGTLPLEVRATPAAGVAPALISRFR